jgi:Spy/CpxP family protein refolding chaperone
MKHGTKILTTLAVAVVIGSGAVAYKAHAARDERGHGRRFFCERFTELGVTNEQKAEVKAILHKHQPTAEPLLKRFVTERRTLRDLIHAGAVDEKAIRDQAAKVAAVGADLAVERAHVAHEIRAVLAPEQIDKLKDMRVDIDARIGRGLDRIAKRIAED